MNSVAAGQSDQWRARLELGYEFRAGNTVVSHRRHYGPLRVQKPFYPESGVCHSYILHPPGGVASGDVLEIDIHCRTGSQALLTTPASGKFYLSDGRESHLSQHFRVDDDAVLEWLPQENIVFNGARGHIRTQVHLANSARFIGMEITCLGRPAAGERFDAGIFRQDIDILRDDMPLFHDSIRLGGNDTLATEQWGLRGHAVLGTLIATLPPDAPLDLEPVLAQCGDEFSVTRLRELVVGRCLCADTGSARSALLSLWNLLRPAVCGRPGCIPRIWNT